MSSSIGQKKKFRKRRRGLTHSPEEDIELLQKLWTEYKTVKQYQCLGDLLEELRLHGTGEGVRRYVYERSLNIRNGHHWLTKDPPWKGESIEDDFFNDTYRRLQDRVLLREPEVCRMCGLVFLSMYTLKSCVDHQGLEPLYGVAI